MHQRRLVRLLLVPSLTSGAAALAVAVSILGYSGWLYINDNQIFYNYLFGPYGLDTYIWQNSQDFSSWYQAFLASPVAYYMLVGGVAVAVGLIVFAVLQGMSLAFGGSIHLWQAAHGEGVGNERTLRELLSRLGLRVVGVIGWGVYAAFFVSSIVPFTIVLNQFGIERWSKGQAIAIVVSAGAGLVLALGLHLHVIFMRLCLLRPRVFGGSDAIEAIEADSEHAIQN